MDRYTLQFGFAFVATICLAWSYVWLYPLGFMNKSFVDIQAKRALSFDCRPAKTAYFGDSRIEAGIVPAVTRHGENFGVAQGTAIEAEFLLRHVLSCKTRPSLVILGISPHGFEYLQPPFWTSTLGYGLLTFRDTLRVERLAQVVEDRTSLTKSETPDGLSGPVRDWLYALRFPVLYFSNIVQGRLFERYAENRAEFEAVLDSAGFVPRPVNDHYVPVRYEIATRFDAMPLQTYFLNRFLTEAESNHVRVALIAMPIRDDTLDFMSPDYIREFFEYLKISADRHKNVMYVSSRFPVLPAADFADNSHLNPSAAAAFSRQIASAVRSGEAP